MNIQYVISWHDVVSNHETIVQRKLCVANNELMCRLKKKEKLVKLVTASYETGENFDLIQRKFQNLRATFILTQFQAAQWRNPALLDKLF